MCGISSILMKVRAWYKAVYVESSISCERAGNRHVVSRQQVFRLALNSVKGVTLFSRVNSVSLHGSPLH